MNDLHEGPLTPVSTVQSAPVTLTRREERRLRRKRRRRGEEILGWILVPVIVFGIYWGVSAGLGPADAGQSHDREAQLKAALRGQARVRAWIENSRSGSVQTAPAFQPASCASRRKPSTVYL
jgi:hypothetical protein